MHLIPREPSSWPTSMAVPAGHKDQLRCPSLQVTAKCSHNKLPFILPHICPSASTPGPLPSGSSPAPPSFPLAPASAPQPGSAAPSVSKLLPPGQGCSPLLGMRGDLPSSPSGEQRYWKSISRRLRSILQTRKPRVGAGFQHFQAHPPFRYLDPRLPSSSHQGPDFDKGGWSSTSCAAQPPSLLGPGPHRCFPLRQSKALRLPQ